MEHYEIIKYLSEGVQGTISLAKDKRTGKMLVLKKFTKGNRMESEFQKKELISIKKLRSRDNSYIPTFYESFVYDDCRYISMEYIDGSDLESFINRYATIEARMFFVIAIQILLGLKYIHSKNLIHNDIAGRNIMISSKFEVKFIDFGWSCEYIPIVPIVWNNYNVALDRTTGSFIARNDPLTETLGKVKVNKEYTVGDTVDGKNIYASVAEGNKTDKILTSCTNYGNYDLPPEIFQLMQPDDLNYVDKFYFGRDVWGASIILFQLANKNVFPFEDIKDIAKLPNETLYSKLKDNMKTQKKSNHYDKRVNDFVNFMLNTDWKSRPTVDNGIDYLVKKVFSAL